MDWLRVNYSLLSHLNFHCAFIIFFVDKRCYANKGWLTHKFADLVVRLSDDEPMVLCHLFTAFTISYKLIRQKNFEIVANLNYQTTWQLLISIHPFDELPHIEDHKPSC